MSLLTFLGFSNVDKDRERQARMESQEKALREFLDAVRKGTPRMPGEGNGQDD